MRFVKTIFVIFALFLAEQSHGQKEYLVTLQGDTLTGRVAAPIFSRKIKLSTENRQKKSFKLEELITYQTRRATFRMVKFKHKKKTKVHRLKLLIDGHIQLYNDWDDAFWEYVVCYQNKFVRIDNRNCIDWLWPILMSCDLFDKKYGRWGKFRIRNLFWDTDREHRTKEVIEFYNRACH